MRSIDEQDSANGSNSYRELRLLTEVQLQPEITQRQLAGRLGIAVGMTNLLLRNLTQKGYVRITRAGWKRWLYAVTPEGFSRKIQLTFTYINRFMDQYRKVREMLREELALEQLNAESRVAIYGTGDVAELVYLGLRDFGIEEIEVFDCGRNNGIKFLGLRVQEMSSFRPEQYDRVVVASLGEAKEQYLELRKAGVPPEKLVLFFSSPEALPVQNGRNYRE